MKDFRTILDQWVGLVASGMGGVGKTCILRAIVNRSDITNRFPDGIYFAALEKDDQMPLRRN